MDSTDIAKKRKQLGLTPKGFASAVGIGSYNDQIVRSWESGEQSPAPEQLERIADLGVREPFKPSDDASQAFTFIDLFAGIGGIRLPFQELGGRCVFSSEWDRFAQKTYQMNYGEIPAGDIREVKSTDIPDFDILLGGFPCQPFSLAGLSKKRSLDRPTGFDDQTQGTLFFEIKRILADKRPKAFLLENVKHLQSHDKKRTFTIIRQSLEDELGYHVRYKVLDAMDWTCQHRERIFIVGFRDPSDFSFENLRRDEMQHTLGEILEANPANCYTINDHLWDYLRDYKRKHEALGHGFGYSVVGPDDVTRTLSARYSKDGSEILIRQTQGNPRRLTPRECARLQGFPDEFIIPVSDCQAYKQFGNSVSVPVIRAIAKEMLASKPFCLIERPEAPKPTQTEAQRKQSRSASTMSKRASKARRRRQTNDVPLFDLEELQKLEIDANESAMTETSMTSEAG